MTKKHYELFANEINKRKGEGLEIEMLVNVCKTVFYHDNPFFQADKFTRACYEGKHIRKSIQQG